MKARKHRPILMFDLAVPRDIEGEVDKLDDVFLYTVDDLGKIAREGMDIRQNRGVPGRGDHRKPGRRISCTGSATASWCRPSARCAITPSVRAATNWSARCARLSRGEDPQVVLEQLSRALTNKFLHAPTHTLNYAGEDEREQLAEVLRRVYQIQRPE